MRVFIILCLVAVACANKLGYNYQHSVGLFTPSSSLSALHSLPSSVHSTGLFTPSGTSYGPQAELEKEFFTFSANDNDFKNHDALNKLSNAVKQGQSVIFIKGPENRGLENAALALAVQAADRKTAIYVLNKQADLGDLSNKLNSANKNNNNKPDVHFVKYRTPEDAAKAQKAIQSHYDNLSGPSHSHNGGDAHVLNFASKAPVSAPVQASSVPNKSYLPASILRS